MQTIKQEYLQHEQALRAETQELHRLLDSEKEKIRANREMTANLVTQRVALDAELGQLRRLYEQENKQWDAKYAQEQEARRLEVTMAQNSMLELQKNAEAALAELEKSKSKLSNDLARKEMQKQSSILSMKDELQ